MTTLLVPTVSVITKFVCSFEARGSDRSYIIRLQRQMPLTTRCVEDLCKLSNQTLKIPDDDHFTPGASNFLQVMPLNVLSDSNSNDADTLSR